MNPEPAFPEAARIDRSALTRLAVHGRDAKDFLHRITSNDVAALRPGEGCAALVLERTGRIVDRLIACDRGEDMLLIGSRGRARAVREALDKYVFTEDVVVEDRSAGTGLVTVFGEDAAAHLGGALGAKVVALPRFHHRGLDVDGEAVMVVRAEDVAGSSFHVIFSEKVRGSVEERLSSVPAIDDGGWRAWRVASGVPEFGEEYTERTIAPETRMLDAISFTKGCYPGQEVVARIRTYGRPKRALVRVRIEGEDVPNRGATLTERGEDVGEVVTAVRVGGTVMALGYVLTGREQPGTRLEIRTEPTPRSVHVLPLTPAGEPE